jgi:c(7)-type cytochrome triheme protein
MITHKSTVYELIISVIAAIIAVSYAVKLEATPDKSADRQFAKAFVSNPPLPFHDTHIRFIEKCADCQRDCTDCHSLNKETGSYSLNVTFCKKCHLPSPTPVWNIPIRARRLNQIAFTHVVHERTNRAGKLKCVDCHQTTMKDRQTRNSPLITADRCLSCHAEKAANLSEKNCDRCHVSKEINRIEPLSHDKTWPVTHGKKAEWDPTFGHGEQCVLCHQNAACIACHRTQAPRNHTGLWRVRTHGTVAKWDRDRCKTCHEAGACISCHRRTPPLNHRGDFLSNHGRASGFDDRCMVCHNPSWCANCHKAPNRLR